MLYDGLARFRTVEAGKASAGFPGHPSVRADDDRERQVVPHGHRVIVWIVSGRHLHAARAELRVHQLIGDDGNGFVL